MRTDAQKLEAIRGILDETDAGTVTPATPVTPTAPVTPVAPATLVGYPAGDELLFLLATVHWAFPQEVIAWDGYRLCGCPTDTNEPCNKWNDFKNKASGSNVLTQAAIWLHAGWSVDMMNQLLKQEGRSVSAEQLAPLIRVMQNYGLQ